MTDATPLTATGAQDLQQVEAQLDNLRAVGDTDPQKFERMGGVDAILALTRRQMALQGKPNEIIAVRDPESGSRVSSAWRAPTEEERAAAAADPRGAPPPVDPREAAIGLTAPEPRDPQAVERHLELLGVDVEALPAESRALGRALSEAVPPTLVGGVVRLTQEIEAMEGPAKEFRYSEAMAVRDLGALWGSEYDRKMASYEGAMRQLPPRVLAYLEARGLDLYPPAMDAVVRFWEQEFLTTDDGRRWILQQAGAEVAEKDRADAEARAQAAKDRAALERRAREKAAEAAER